MLSNILGSSTACIFLLSSMLWQQVMTAPLFCVILAVTGLPSIFHHSHLLAVYHGKVSREIYYEAVC